MLWTDFRLAGVGDSKLYFQSLNWDISQSNVKTLKFSDWSNVFVLASISGENPD